MRLTERLPSRRTAFTLVELLVVIGIIAILIALTGAAIFRFWIKGPQLWTTNEINQLDNALLNFKTTYKVEYPPDQFYLSNNRADYNPTGNAALDALKAQSLSYLSRMFPRMDWTTPIDWAGGTWTFNPQHPRWDPMVLTGDQCLVFFLGGIPATGGGTLGFSTDSRNPTNLQVTMRPPLFNFAASRLYLARVRFKGPAPNFTPIIFSPFYSYKDYWEVQPYLYFSSNKTRNGYNPADAITVPDPFDPAQLAPPQTVAPYYQLSGPPIQYYNPDTCQIISAGNDTRFAPGGYRDPQTGNIKGDTNFYGKDDQSNFNQGSLLGVGGS